MINQLSLIILLLIMYFSYCGGYAPNCPMISLNQLIINKRFKTGDLLFFKKNGSVVPYCYHTYLSHVALVYVDLNEEIYNPQLFEINYLNNHDHIYVSQGDQVNICNLSHKATSFDGEIYYKELQTPIDDIKIKKLSKFFKFAKDNMYYEQLSGLMVFSRKYLNEPYHFGTNCAELILYCLIILEIIPFTELNNKRLHYFNYFVNISHTPSNKYLPFVKIFILNY